jgi:hypothetical protein
MKRLLILLLLLAAALSFAQGAPDRYPVFLLSYPSLQRDLQLAPATVKKINAIQQAAEKWYMAQISPTPGNPSSLHQPDFKAVQQHALQTEQQIVALLSASQKTRLRQVGFQYAGPLALTDPRIANQLGVTAKQNAALLAAGKKARSEFEAKMRDISTNTHLQPGKVDSVQAMTKKITAAKLAMAKSLNVSASQILTSNQMTQWKKMQGRPFPIEALYSQPVRKV